MSKHADNARKHARQRASERFGMALTSAEYADLVDECRSGRAGVLLQQSQTRTWHLVYLRGTPAVAVLSSTTKNILTFMSLQQAQEFHQQGKHDRSTTHGHAGVVAGEGDTEG